MIFWAAECGPEWEPGRQAGHPFAIREVTLRENTVEEENKTRVGSSSYTSLHKETNKERDILNLKFSRGEAKSRIL